MRDDPLTIQDFGTQNQKRTLKLSGPLTLSTLFEFQNLVRGENSASLLLDFTNVPYIDSAGLGALVGAYVRLQREGHSVALAGVNDRIRGALRLMQVEKFFEYPASGTPDAA
jgi:anti-sigma B factor antagonist